MQQAGDTRFMGSALGKINRQLESKNIIMTESRINIIDATPIEPAQSGSGKDKDGNAKRDAGAGWHFKADSGTVGKQR